MPSCRASVLFSLTLNLNVDSKIVLSRLYEALMIRVNLANVLDEGLRIRERGLQINSKEKIQTKKAKLDAC
jgi:hypothetical protein